MEPERRLQLTSSNIPPDQTEVEVIREYIDAQTKIIDRLNLEAPSRRQLTVLERGRASREHEKVVTELEALRRVLGAVRRLPAEVLSEIFFLIVHDRVDRYQMPDRLANISMVCKFWHAVANSTPHLWNHLILRPVGDYHFNVANLPAWFERAGTLPRHLEYESLEGCLHSDFGFRGLDDCLLVAGWQVAKLLTEGPRLNSLSLTGVRLPCVEELTVHMKENRTSACRPWDSLESLRITGSNITLIGASPFLRNFFGSLPLSIRSLRLRGLEEFGRPRALYRGHPLPADNVLYHVTTLCIKHPFLSTMLEFLPLCTSLTNLTIAPHPREKTLPEIRQACRLPHVRTLKLRGWNLERTAKLPQLLIPPL